MIVYKVWWTGAARGPFHTTAHVWSTQMQKLSTGELHDGNPYKLRLLDRIHSFLPYLKSLRLRPSLPST